MHVLLFLIYAPVFAQGDSMIGEYFLQLGDVEARIIEYTLTLEQDGTFYFHSYAKSSENIGVPEEVHQYGRGTWKSQDKKILFFTNPEKDLTEKYSLNLANSRAHFITKSKRSSSEHPFKTRLKFFESDIFWIKGVEIFKR